MDWQQKVGVAAYSQWIADARTSALPLDMPLEMYVTTFCQDVLYDVDNVLKWTLDGLKPRSDPQRLAKMNRKQSQLHQTYQAIYADDQLIYKLTSERIDLNVDIAGKIEEALLPFLVTRAITISKFVEFLHITLFWEEKEV